MLPCHAVMPARSEGARLSSPRGLRIPLPGQPDTDVMERPSLLFMGPLPPPYHGITVSTARLLDSRLREEFHLVHFDTSDHRDLDNMGRLEARNLMLAFMQLIRYAWICARKRPAIAYVLVNAGISYARDGLFVLIAKRLGRSKVVIHLRGADFLRMYNRSGQICRMFVDATLRNADRVIVLGEGLRHIFQPWFVRESIDVIPNGTPFNPDLSRKAGLQAQNGGRLVIAYLGNLIEAKGIVDLLLAASEVAKWWPDAEFRFAGAWWNLDEGKAKSLELIRKHGLHEIVRFNGVVTGQEKEDFLLSADIFAFPTFYEDEGHPNVILEAMAAGLPVISTDIAAIPETVHDGVNGFIVPIRDPAALADRILTLARNPALRSRMGAEGRRLYEEQYTQEINVERMAETFRRCLEGR